MKCDKLESYYYYEDRVFTPATHTYRVYHADEVDAAIAELKDEVKFSSDFSIAARKDIEEMRGQHQMLKQFGHYKLSPVPGKMINHEVRQYVSYNVVCMIINHLESENADLKQKLESVQATAYTESVDAGMRERKLKRALWLARSYRAEARKNYWYARSCHEGDECLWSIDGSAVKYIGCIKRTNFDWLKIWSEVESKCLNKAEEYR